MRRQKHMIRPGSRVLLKADFSEKGIPAQHAKVLEVTKKYRHSKRWAAGDVFFLEIDRADRLPDDYDGFVECSRDAFTVLRGKRSRR